MITSDDWKNLKPGESITDKDGNICNFININPTKPNQQFVYYIVHYKGTETNIILCDGIIFNERWEPIFELNHPSATIVSLPT